MFGPPLLVAEFSGKKKNGGLSPTLETGTCTLPNIAAQQSGPNKKKQSKDSPVQTSYSYKDMLSGIKVAICDKIRGPVLSSEQVKMVDDKLMQLIEQAALRDDYLKVPAPNFLKFVSGPGAIWITCANEFTKHWLERAVATFEGSDLILLEGKQVPKRPKVLVNLPQTSAEDSLILRQLEFLNKGLSTENWKLLNRKDQPNFVTTVWSIDYPSYEVLKTREFRLFWTRGPMEFKPINLIEQQFENLTMAD